MTLTPEMSVATQWQSHLPALLACIAVTGGDVLELGIGHFSTPHLHAFCLASGRVLVSVEPDASWLGEFKGRYGSQMHWFSDRIPDKRFSVALVDHSPGGMNRADALRQLVEVCEFVVVHDAQKDAENFQAIEPMLEGLNWHLCTDYFPHTLVASKTRQIPEVLKGM